MTHPTVRSQGKRRRLGPASVAGFVLLAVAGCRSGRGYRAPAEPFWQGDPAGTYAALEADGKAGIAPEDEALWRCEIGTAALCVGDEAGAFRAFHAASAIMGTIESSSAETARAILGEEATKTWKGDPHERCMNALYKGLLYWRRGDLDNAAACFRRGLLADGWSEAGEAQTDFAALQFLLGWVSERRGDSEQARYSFREAAGNAPGNPYASDPKPGERNVLAVVDIGLGPVKVAEGEHGELARYYARDHVDGGVEILVDGVPAGRSAPAADLYVQAVTRGKRVLDGIRRGKAVFKEGATIAGIVVLSEGISDRKWEKAAMGAGLLLLAALTRAEADTRHWSLLPAEVHLLPLHIAPGRRQLTVRVVDRSGNPIPGCERVFETVVPESRDTLYYFRSAGGRAVYGVAGSAEPP